MTHVLIIIIVALIFESVVEYIFKSWSKRAPTKRAQTLLSVLHNIFRAAVFVAMGLFVLSAFRINVTPLLASAGIVGLAVGFGSQVLIKDIISGIFFILENQFNEGDTVRIDTIEGVVEHVGLRTISVRETNTGALNIFPNGSITKLANLTDRYASINVLVTIPATNDVDRAEAILKRVADKLADMAEVKDHFYEPIEVHTLDDLADGKMTFRAIIKTHPGKQENVARKFRYLVKKEFDKEKVSLS